jgi:tRNA pseudouridine55 synthase
MAEITGVLPVDKPEGPTSHDIVAAARRALGTRRIGHTGTLDPFASGLLLLCLGPATRLAEYITPLSKRYRAVMRLGEATETDDLLGRVIDRSGAWRDLREEDVRSVLAAFVGSIDQLPPMYSAKKVAGERLYAAARRGEEVDRASVAVRIHRIEVLAIRLPDVEFEVECGAGTYIRSIARDVGGALGVGGHLRALRRTRSGDFDVAAAVPVSDLGDAPRVRSSLVSPADAVRHLPAFTVTAEELPALTHGRALTLVAGRQVEGPVRLLSEDGRLLAIAESQGGRFQPRKVFS